MVYWVFVAIASIPNVVSTFHFRNILGCICNPVPWEGEQGSGFRCYTSGLSAYLPQTKELKKCNSGALSYLWAVHVWRLGLPSANDYWLLFTYASDIDHANGIPRSINTRRSILFPFSGNRLHTQPKMIFYLIFDDLILFCLDIIFLWRKCPLTTIVILRLTCKTLKL